MSALSDASVRVGHYDGTSGIRRQPLLVADGETFTLEEDGAVDGPYRFADLTSDGPLGGVARYGLRKRPGWRIEFDETPPKAIAAKLPGTRRYGGVIDRIGLVPAVIAFVLISAAALFALASSPALIVKLIPRSTETRIGDLLMVNTEAVTCKSPEGLEALKALRRRLGARDEDLDIRVIRSQTNNALALPGGRILILSGLIDQAKSPDEVAGVLAHELGHDEHRDPLHQIVRQYGLSLLLGGMDQTVANATQLAVLFSYGSSAERTADDHAIELLRNSRISGEGIAGFFRRLEARERAQSNGTDIRSYIDTHPASAARRAKFEKATEGIATTPALTPEQWRALRHICDGVSYRRSW